MPRKLFNVTGWAVLDKDGRVCAFYKLKRDAVSRWEHLYEAHLEGLPHRVVKVEMKEIQR